MAAQEASLPSFTCIRVAIRSGSRSSLEMGSPLPAELWQRCASATRVSVTHCSQHDRSLLTPGITCHSNVQSATCSVLVAWCTGLGRTCRQVMPSIGQSMSSKRVSAAAGSVRSRWRSGAATPHIASTSDCSLPSGGADDVSAC